MKKIASKDPFKSSAWNDSATPEWIIKLQCAIFAVLWSLTMLPNVLVFRNLALVIGAIIGFYVLIKSRNILATKRAIPLLVVGSLFIWVTLHLLLVGENHDLQWNEYQSLWKRALLGSIFALGLGLSLAGAKKSYTAFIFVGICSPTFIFYVKYLAKVCSIYYGLSVPEAMALPSDNNHHFYIPKISYVFYCLPALAISLGCLVRIVKSKDPNWGISLIYSLVILGVIGVFYLENIKNGFIYVSLLVLIFLISVFRGRGKVLSVKIYFLLAILGVLTLWAIFNNIRSNDSWKSLAADSKVALQAQPSEVWNKPGFSYPLNDHGNAVSPTNFDRIFYLKTAVTFIKQYPLGYGLVHSSFGHIARESFSNAPLIQSHSGWMDLALGLGIPGVIILLSASILAMLQVASAGSPWNTFGVWSLLSIVLLFITTEVSQKNFVDTYVWLIVFVAALGLKNTRASSEA